MKTFIYLW